jgi:tetratricopeptide (TPR) repeat protein
MKLRQSVLAVFFSVIFFAVFSSNSFAMVEKFNPVKSVTEEAIIAFNGAQAAFINGMTFQRNCEYGGATACYVESLRLWRSETAYFNLAYCFFALKQYAVAEKAAIKGLEMSSFKENSVNAGFFMILLGNIYYESGNIQKAWDAYGIALRLPISEDGHSFIIERMKNMEICDFTSLPD